MKTIIAGSRGIDEFDGFAILERAVNCSGFEITEVVSGTARGVDKMGEAWASLNNVPIKRFPADWARFGRGAGHRRNAEMAEYADALIAIWDGTSKGTMNMINQAKLKGLKIYFLNLGE